MSVYLKFKNIKMKNVFVIIAVLLFSVSAYSQVRDDVDMILEIFKMEKKAMVNDYMELNDEQSKKFWPIYEEYEQKRKAIVQRRIDMLAEFSDHRSKLSDGTAKEIAEEFFSIRNDDSKLQKKYFKKISKAIGAANAVSFIQLEEYIRTAINFELQDVIPFVGEG
jgi:hypothetical protein